MPNHKAAICMATAFLVNLVLTSCSQQITSGTPTALATPNQTPKVVLAAMIPPTAAPTTPTPDLKATVAACKPMAQVTDVTVPDNSPFKPGETFAKVWRLLSAGDCAWERGSVLVFQGGENFGTPDSIPVDPVEVGRSVEVSVTMKAPPTLGTYIGLWVFRQPSGQIMTTADVRIVVLVPSPTPGAVPVAPAHPTASPKSSSIPPVGSGPFSVDANASGPWNCSRTQLGGWAGDFYIGVWGGPGNYTISDPEHCQWIFSEQRFVCHYGAVAMGQPIRLTLQISCPGCTPQQVTVYGREVDTREESPNTCRAR
jgi:hypothetical protein